MVREHDTGDHRIAQVTGATFLLQECHQVSRVLRSSGIEWGNSVFNLVENSFERLEQQRSSPSEGQDLQPELDLQDRG